MDGKTNAQIGASEPTYHIPVLSVAKTFPSSSKSSYYYNLALYSSGHIASVGISCTSDNVPVVTSSDTSSFYYVAVDTSELLTKLKNYLPNGTYFIRYAIGPTYGYTYVKTFENTITIENGNVTISGSTNGSAVSNGTGYQLVKMYILYIEKK